MFFTLLAGSVLIVATTLIHAVLTGLTLDGLRATHPEHWIQRSSGRRAGVVCGLVLALFLAAVLEASLWALVYVHSEAIPSFAVALYFSLVTFTTLGYGDVTLVEHWGLLASFQAATGILIFGWSTALIVATVQRIYFHRS